MTKFASRGMTRFMTGAAMAALALAAAPAFAQAADDDANEGEILVLGVTKQVQNIQDVPTTITAFSGETLDVQGIREVGEVAKFTPGFNVRAGNNNPTGFSLAMRGQVQGDQIASLEPSVGIYIDDMYIARAYGLNVEMMDVGNIQVLKGPQGTLFGRNTSAGAMLIQTNDPKFGEVSGSAKLTYGRFNEWNTTGVINLSMGDNFAVRGAVSYGERDGFVRDIGTGHKYNGKKTFNGRLKLAWKPSETITVNLSGDWYHGKMDGQARQGLFLGLNPLLFAAQLGVAGSAAQVAALQGIANNQLAATAGKPDLTAVTPAAATPGAPAQGIFNDMKTQTYIGKVTADLGFGELKWINGYRKVKGDNLLDLDGFGLPIHFTQGTQNLKQYSTELQLTGSTMDDRLDFALGLTYFIEKGTDRSRSSLFGNPNWSQFLGDIDNDSFGAYGQASYKASDALTITAGLRYSWDKKGITQFSGNALNNAVLTSCSPTSVSLATNCARSRSDSWNNLSYTIGLDYKLSDDVMLFAKQSRGYRAGAQQLRSLTLTDNAPAQPEIVNEQEIGLKAEFMDKKVRFNIAGYHNKVKDAQRSVLLNVGGTPQTYLENASTETWGVEADLNVRVADGFDLFANFSALDPKYTKYDGFTVVGTALAADNKLDTRFANIVKKQFMLGANYSGDLGFARVSANVNYAWQGDMAQGADTLERYTRSAALVGGFGFSASDAAKIYDAMTTKSHGITNARLGFAFGADDNYELALWGRNVFDVRRTGYVLFLNGVNYIGASWNDPATYGVTATIKF